MFTDNPLQNKGKIFIKKKINESLGVNNSKKQKKKRNPRSVHIIMASSNLETLKLRIDVKTITACITIKQKLFRTVTMFQNIRLKKKIEFGMKKKRNYNKVWNLYYSIAILRLHEIWTFKNNILFNKLKCRYSIASFSMTVYAKKYQLLDQLLSHHYLGY